MCRQNRHSFDVPANRTWFSPRNELPLDAWVSLFEQVAPFRPWVYLTGGEPSLYPHFRELIREAKKRKLVVQLQTNGTTLTKHADFLVEMGLEAVTVSLDGTREIHDSVRGVPGTFARVEEGMKSLVEARQRAKSAGPLLSFNFTISKANLDSLVDTVAYAIDMKMDFIQIQHTMHSSREIVARHNELFSQENAKALGLDVAVPSVCEDEYYVSELTEDDVRKIEKNLEEARALAKGRIKLHSMPNIPSELIPPYYLDLNYEFIEACDNFWKTLRVLADGTVSPCLNFVVGNIARQSFAEIWNGSQMNRLRELFSKGLVPGCARCCQRHYCTAGRAF